MRVAIIGSRNLTVDISKYIPDGTTESISGGAKGIDTLAEKYADEHNRSEERRVGKECRSRWSPYH